MKTLAISRFRATCAAVLERVRRTGEPILVTRFGEPLAKVVPPPVPARSESWLGSFRDRGKILGEIVSPATSEGEWEVHAPERCEPRSPYEIYRDLDLGPGGYANRPAKESRRGAREAVLKAQDDD